jgi:hypothetical protein
LQKKKNNGIYTLKNEREKPMTVKKFIEILQGFNEAQEVIFYQLENNDLRHVGVETILDCDNRCEITLEGENL